MRTFGWVAVVLLGFTPALRADDWPQYRGPARDGVSRETGLLKQWPQGGPALLWTYDEAGVGYSGPAVVGDRLYLAGGRGEAEHLIALDIKTVAGGTAKQVWCTEIGPLFQWKGNSWNVGPNATPTVGGGRVYALGGFGDLVCVEAASGKETWRKNQPRDLGGEVDPIGGGLTEPTSLGWGYASSPLLDGDRLICVPGGKRGLLAALNPGTGAVLWQSQDVTDQASYSSPLAVEIGGVKQYVQVTNGGAVGVAAANGKKLWSFRRNPAFDDVVIATPIFHDNCLYATVGFNQGCDLIKLTPKGSEIGAERVYTNKTVDNRDGGVVLVDGHVYGHSETLGWFCQEFKTGKIVWSDKALGRGSVTCADGLLYCCTEKDGIVALVQPTPEGWTEAGRLKLPRKSTLRRPSGGLWTHPVVANGKLYIRDQELLFCYDIKR